MKKHHYTYLVLNIKTGKLYFGVRTSRRRPEKDIHYFGSGRYIKAALKQYGKHNFKKYIIHEYETSEQAFAMERYVVDKEWIESGCSYNLVCGGVNGDWGDASKEKMKLSSFNRARKDCEYCEKNVAINIYAQFHGANCKKNPNLSEEELKTIITKRARSAEFKSNMSKRVRGMKMSDESRNKMSIAKAGFKGRSGAENPMYGKKPWNYGKIMSAEFCASISKGLKK